MNENEQYHQDTTRISKSGLDQINKTPANYFERYLNQNRIEEKQSAALLFGSAFHAYILEPEVFKSEFIILPYFSGKGSRDKKEQFILNAGKKTPISIDDFQTIVGMADSINRHKVARKLINETGFSERVFHWTDKETGVKCKCKPDRYNSQRKFIVDLKSTENASEDDFKFSAKKFRYYVQSAFYSDGLEANNVPVDGFIFIAVEKKPPYLVNCFMYGENENDFGREQYKENLKTYAECLDSNNWPGYTKGIKTIEIPGMVF